MTIINAFLVTSSSISTASANDGRSKSSANNSMHESCRRSIIGADDCLSAGITAIREYLSLIMVLARIKSPGTWS